MEVHTHTLTSYILQSALRAALPYSVSLVYRNQHPNQTPHARILATFPQTALAVPHCWAAAYFDRSTRPATELWLFAAGEQPGHSSAAGDARAALCPSCARGVLALLDYMAGLPIPPLHPEEAPALDMARSHEKEYPESGPGVVYPLIPGTYMRHLLLPGVVTLGACHWAVVKLLREAGVLRSEFPGVGAELDKFLFKVGDLPATRELPEGLRWGQMREGDLPVVQARTSIPRATMTLLTLKSLGVFEEKTDRAVAWAFIGLDGSLTTLHTEEEYRGKGIAKAVAAKIISENASGLAKDEYGNSWSHADVYVGNVQSARVCKSLGGRATWKHFWVRIDLGKAGSLAGTKVNGMIEGS